MGRLNAAQEQSFKRRRREGADISRGAWMESTALSDRDKRCLERGWNRRAERANKRFAARKSYLGRRLDELQKRDAETVAYVNTLRIAMLGDITKLLHDDDGDDDDVANTDVAAGAQPAGGENTAQQLSAVQIMRLYNQAAAVAEVLREQHDRDLLQIEHLSNAERVAGEARQTDAAIKEADAQVQQHMEEASILRLRFSSLEIAARVAEGALFSFKPSTILSWVRQFRELDGHFRRDGRGVREREWILSEEDLQLDLLAWLKAQKRVTVKNTCEFINNVLLSREGGILKLAKYGLSLPISESTVNVWMRKLGCTYDGYKQSYYSDGHERPDVVESRKEYLDKKRRLALRRACWMRVEVDSLTREEYAVFEGMLESGDEAFWAETYLFENNGKKTIEFHVDFLGGLSDGTGEDERTADERHDELRAALGKEGGWYSVRFDDAARVPCEAFHAPDVCRCNRKVYHIGQDESIYKAYTRKGNEWVIRGVRGFRKKTEGPGEMVSALQDERRGYGLEMSENELAQVNGFRATVGRPALKATPGVRFLVHGKNKEGYWGFVQFEEQVIDVMDCLEVLEPGMQHVIEVDHSAGHAKYREDGLHVVNMNVKFGGKQHVLRDTVITEGCLGPGEAKMYLNGDVWSTEFVEGVTTRTVDLKPKLGEVQNMAFAPSAPPPFYDWHAAALDSVERKVTTKRSRGSGGGGGANAEGGSDGNAQGGSSGTDKVVDVVKEGYLGKAKGMRQVVWERGWWVDGMSSAQKASSEMNMAAVLGKCPDFKNERTALQHTVESRGHLLLLSPKFHPEVAGVGIEYSWGMSKLKFRRELNDEIPAHLHHNMVASMCTKTILTIPRVRRFARRTRDFCRAYFALDKSGGIDSKDTIEKARKVSKAHRNIIDMQPGFIDSQ